MDAPLLPEATCKSGGTRAQRRNNQKRKREVSAHESIPAFEPPSNATESVRKKSKKEKKRERKALAAADQVARAQLRSNPSAGDESVSRRIFVGHLPQSATEAELRQRFEQCGEITELVMLRRHNGSHRFKGQAFLAFMQEAQANRALALDGTEFVAAASAVPAKKIVVSRANAVLSTAAGSDKAAAAADALAASSAPASSASSSCVVSNLPSAATAKEVRASFREWCGSSTIRKVRLLPAVNDTRRGFIDFSTTAAAATAVTKTGAVALGRVLVIGYSKRAEAPSGDGRRSREARVRRRLKRDEQREGEGKTTRPILSLNFRPQ